MTTPTGFERATGVVEGRRKCNNPDCGKLYPVTNHTLQSACPICKSTATTKVK